MMNIDICELDILEFENAIIKNKFIQSSCKEWIGFVDSTVTNGNEINQIINENLFLQEYDLFLFGMDCLEGEVGLLELLDCPQNEIYALIFRKELLLKIGSFNQLIKESNIYEFVLRAAEKGSVYVIPCSADKKTNIDSFGLAYIMRRYMKLLRENSKLDQVFLRVVQLMESMGKTAEFNQAMNTFLADSKAYDRIVENTAPCLVIIGDEICAGVLAGFARNLADELAALGQAVISTDGKYGNCDNISLEKLLEWDYKAVIGFHASVFTQKMYQAMKGKKVQFWFDNPIFSQGFLMKHEKDVHILCQDAYYTEFIKQYYHFPKAIHFSPGGKLIENLPREKKYDVTFIGNYEIPPEFVYEDEYEKGFFNYMNAHPDSTFEQGIYEFGKTFGDEYDEDEIFRQLHRVENVCQDILRRDRHYIIEKIVGNGIKLHVFSENWNDYHGKGRENLIIHPMIYGNEPFEVWAQSKIGLNIMRGHKAGMTERVANIMLCKSCCLTDENVYLKELFEEDENIVFFKRTALNELPEKINYLLEHDVEREKIAVAGYEKAIKEHTWRQRAKRLLELLNS